MEEVQDKQRTVEKIWNRVLFVSHEHNFTQLIMHIDNFAMCPSYAHTILGQNIKKASQYDSKQQNLSIILICAERDDLLPRCWIQFHSIAQATLCNLRHASAATTNYLTQSHIFICSLCVLWMKSYTVFTQKEESQQQRKLWGAYDHLQHLLSMKGILTCYCVPPVILPHWHTLSKR